MGINQVGNIPNHLGYREWGGSKWAAKAPPSGGPQIQKNLMGYVTVALSGSRNDSRQMGENEVGYKSHTVAGSPSAEVSNGLHRFVIPGSPNGEK